MIEAIVAEVAEVAEVPTEASALIELTAHELGLVGGGIAAVAFV